MTAAASSARLGPATAGRSRPGAGARLSHDVLLDPVRCAGHGLCHQWLPELVGLDEWGFPLLAGGGLATGVPTDLIRHAARAADACPALALRLRRR